MLFRSFSGTGLGSSGFGTGLAYGNQDLGLYLNEQPSPKNKESSWQQA